jgi:hypothetical protein
MASADEGSHEARVIHALNVLCRMDPSRVEQNAERLASLLSEEAGDEFLEKVDRPLSVATCPRTEKPYLLCDYNRDGDSHRCVQLGSCAACGKACGGTGPLGPTNTTPLSSLTSRGTLGMPPRGTFALSR